MVWIMHNVPGFIYTARLTHGAIKLLKDVHYKMKLSNYCLHKWWTLPPFYPAISLALKSSDSCWGCFMKTSRCVWHFAALLCWLCLSNSQVELWEITEQTHCCCRWFDCSIVLSVWMSLYHFTSKQLQEEHQICIQADELKSCGQLYISYTWYAM